MNSLSHFAAWPANDPSPAKPKSAAGSPASLDVPILLYHHLVPHDQPNPDWYEISIRQFEQQLDTIKRAGFTTVSLRALFHVLRGEESAPDRMVVLNFDDAFRSFLELGLPALRARGMTASVFLPAGCMGSTNRWEKGRDIPERTVMTADEIRQVIAEGMEVGAHGWEHRNLLECSDEQAREEIFRPYEEMRRCFGAAPQFFAYPYGHCSPRLFPLLKAAGYDGALCIFSGERTVTANRFNMRRIYVHSGDNGLRFRLKLSPIYGRLMAFRGVP